MFDIQRAVGDAAGVASGARPYKVNDTHGLGIRAHASIVASTVASRFVLAREMNGMTQTEGAHALGYRKSGQLSQIESGKKTPPLALLVRAAEAYRVSVDFLLGVCNEPDRDPKMAMRLRVLQSWQRIFEEAAHKLCDSTIKVTEGMGENWEVAHAYLEEGEGLLAAFRSFHRINREAFEEMRGGASLIKAVERFEQALAEARFQIGRNRRILELTIKQVADPQRLAQNMDLFTAGQA